MNSSFTGSHQDNICMALFRISDNLVKGGTEYHLYFNRPDSLFEDIVCCFLQFQCGRIRQHIHREWRVPESQGPRGARQGTNGRRVPKMLPPEGYLVLPDQDLLLREFSPEVSIYPPLRQRFELRPSNFPSSESIGSTEFIGSVGDPHFVLFINQTCLNHGLLGTLRTVAMGELAAGVFANIDLQLLPATFLIADLLASTADRKKCLKNFYLRQGET